MASREASGPATLSVLDRLIDQDPKRSVEAPMTRAQSVREMKAALRRDLEWLLNTRQSIDPAPPAARETARSVYNYGLADISSRSLLSDKDHKDLAREMETALVLFEPRLKRPRVSMEVLDRGYRALHFAIEGLLCMDPAPEPVRFDTLLEIGKGEYEVKGEDGAR